MPRRLTDDERRVVKVMTDPEHALKPHREQAELLGLSGVQLSRIKNSDRVQQALNTMMMRHMGEKLNLVMQSCVASAMIVGKEGHPDRKMLFAMAGLQRNERVVRHLIGLVDGDDNNKSPAQLLTEATTQKRERLEQEASKAITFDGEYEDLQEQRGTTWDDDVDLPAAQDVD